MARRRRGRYKMTPARRAALRKAQAASARKRRFQGIKNFARVGAQVGGTIAAGAILYHAESYARDPGKAVRHAQMAHGFLTGKRGSDPNAPGVNRHRPVRLHQRKRLAHTGYVAGRRINNRQRSRLI